MNTAIEAVLSLVNPVNAELDKFGRWICEGQRLPQVSMRAELSDEGIFNAAFEVVSPQPLYVNETFSKGASAQGLWQWDVVEAFIQPDNATPTYYEFVLSPLGQHFEQTVYKPRAVVDKSLRSGVKVVSQIFPSQPFKDLKWTSKMTVDLKPLGWNATTGRVKWNCFSILGDPNKGCGRSFWSLNLPLQTTPDFHKPEYFAAFE